jgi:RNase H-fold protein (predicted Holliday junction resolvase)
MILGVDFGPANIGLAISEGEIAEPYATVHDMKSVAEIAKKLGVTKIIVGISEGKSKSRSLSFGRKLEKMLQLPVEYSDETLSSWQAGPKGHAKAAAIILQRYLDNHV